MKNNMYIGIDLGDKRCGIALEVEGVVIPKKIVSRVSLVSEIKRLSSSYNIKTIVVGLPFDLYNKDLKQLEKTKDFIAKLKTIFEDKNIVGFDERFSSFEASRVLCEDKIFNTEGKKDDISACIILEDYLKSINYK